MAKTPYIGFSNATLAKALPLKAGDLVLCPRCNAEHPVSAGEPSTRWNPKTQDFGPSPDPMILFFYKCGNETFIAGIDGKSVMGVPVDVKGEV